MTCIKTLLLFCIVLQTGWIWGRDEMGEDLKPEVGMGWGMGRFRGSRFTVAGGEGEGGRLRTTITGDDFWEKGGMGRHVGKG